MSELNFRIAGVSDAFPLMKLYQVSTGDKRHDPLFLDHNALLSSIQSEQETWIVAEKKGEIFAVISSLLDLEQRLCKVQRMYYSPDVEYQDELQKILLENIIGHSRDKADIIYSTSRLLSIEQMSITEEMGFKVLGFFPISSSSSDVSGLTAFFYEGVLERMRHLNFSLHPVVEPFYEILRKKWGLPTLAVSERPEIRDGAYESLPDLEMIPASRFVARRYLRLKERKLLSNNFYPFQEPNTLICDPDEKVEIFAGVYPEKRFAAIIEERLELAVNPSLLYNRVAMMIRGENIAYIEVIMDAADVMGIEFMLMAGFLPCAYFPCLKKHQDMRRDFVVLGRAFENLHVIEGGFSKSFTDFIREYFKLEIRMLMQRSGKLKEVEM